MPIQCVTIKIQQQMRNQHHTKRTQTIMAWPDIKPCSIFLIHFCYCIQPTWDFKIKCHTTWCASPPLPFTPFHHLSPAYFIRANRMSGMQKVFKINGWKVFEKSFKMTNSVFVRTIGFLIRCHCYDANDGEMRTVPILSTFIPTLTPPSNVSFFFLCLFCDFSSTHLSRALSLFSAQFFRSMHEFSVLISSDRVSEKPIWILANCQRKCSYNAKTVRIIETFEKVHISRFVHFFFCHWWVIFVISISFFKVSFQNYIFSHQ